MAPDNETRRAPRGATLLLAGAALLAGATATRAEEPGDVDAGHMIARTWCSSCHLVERATQGTSSGAPSFAAVADMKSTTRMSLTVFLQTPHFPMPNFQLGNDQIANVIAYILSLRTRP